MPETAVPQGCELPCVHWISNPGPQEEHQVLLTAKPSLQSLAYIYETRFHYVAQIRP